MRNKLLQRHIEGQVTELNNRADEPLEALICKLRNLVKSKEVPKKLQQVRVRVIRVVLQQHLQSQNLLRNFHYSHLARLVCVFVSVAVGDWGAVHLPARGKSRFEVATEVFVYFVDWRRKYLFGFGPGRGRILLVF